MPAESPYPNPFEILRYLLRSFDLKQSNKRLDDLAGKRIYDPRELDFAIEECFSGVAEKRMGRITTVLVSKAFSGFYKDYLNEVVGKIPADNVCRAVTLELLIKTCIKDHLVELATSLYGEIGGPHPSFWFSNETSSVGALFEWLNEHEPGWGSFLTSLSKERRDMMSSWANGKELPSAQSIFLLSQPDLPKIDEDFAINWGCVKPLIFVARAIDFIKRESLGLLLLEEARLAIWGADNRVSLVTEVLKIQKNMLDTLGAERSLMALLHWDLRRAVAKTEPNKYQELIRQVRALIQQSEQLQSSLYWIDWYDARWHVYAGDLAKANELYKSAFESALFAAGEKQRHIAEEAIVVAANQLSPDRVFLKQLKWSLINFGYDIASNTQANPSQKVTDTIEDWELELWASSFDSVFPKNGLFPGVDYGSENKTVGPLIVNDFSEIKPDFRSPDRKIKIGETWKRSMPQLVWFAQIENIDVCRKLIERGASVNVASEVGDTPILMALESLNVTEVPWRSLKNELYELISNKQHDMKIINTRTQKKRSLPLISAVETGRLDVVQKILEMGAEPNGRGKTDEQTPLNICVKLIGILKNPDLCKKHQISMPVTPEALDSIRRQSQGMSGFTMTQQQQSLDQKMQTGLYLPVEDLCLELMYKRIHQHMNIRGMREIAKLLITSGADVNAEHASPLKGYTPLMLVAEIDERELFELMLIHGGDIKKTYKDPDTGKEVSILEIAKHFKSASTLQVLKDISPYITVH